MSLRDRLRRAEKAATVNMMAIPQSDGSVKRFHPDALMDAMVSSWDRGRAHLDGEPLPEPHPLLDALVKCPEPDPEEFFAREGWGFGWLASQEKVFRGLEENPGPEVTWNAEGTVCE